MTMICNLRILWTLSIAFCLNGVLCASQAEVFRDFVTKRGGAAAEADTFLATSADTARRINTASHLLIARKIVRPAVPGAEKAERIAQSLMQAAKMQARQQLLRELFTALPEVPFQDRQMAEATYLQALTEDLPEFRLPGIEFIAGGEKGVYWAVAAIRPGEAVAKIRSNLTGQKFLQLYCNNGFVRAKNAFKMQDYPHALRLLREAHSKKYANAAAYILLAQTFAKLGQNADAQTIAKEVLGGLSAQLTADLAEQLGDLFLELKCEPEAQKAFEIAMQRLN